MAEHVNTYVVPKGRAFIDRFLPNTKTGTGERFVGNAPEITITGSSSTLEHFNSEGGISEKDESVDINVTRSGKIVVDNVNAENIALFFQGDAGTKVQTAATAQVETLPAHLGRYIQLGVSAANPTGVRKISNLVIATTGGSPVTIAALNNYEVDDDLGRVYIEPDAAALVEGTDYTFTYDIAASTREIVISKNQSIYCALRLVSNNPVGTNRDVYLPYVKMTPDGDYVLISDEWQKIGFKLEVLKKDANTEAVYVDGRATVTP